MVHPSETKDNASSAWKAARDLHKAPDDRIRAIYENRAAWGARQAAYQEKMRCAYATVNTDSGVAFAWQRLLNTVGHGAALLAIEPVIPALGPRAGNTFLDALLMLALRSERWLQAPEEWTPDASDARQQFGSLARHLLARYPVPAFLDAAWFEGFSPDGRQHQDWFLHIGSGQNIRRAELPVRLTEKAAHYFLQAPLDGSIVGALRWGQTIALGGDEYLARAIADSRLGEILPDEPFWESVLHFFVNQPRMDTSKVGPIVDFIYHRKFGESAFCADAPFDFSDAPEPGFSMKGRTLEALLKRVEQWHEQLARDNRKPRTAWEPTGIAAFSCEARDRQKVVNTWTVRELLNSRELQEEGREMKHCVFSYAANCLNGTTSVWSLRVRPERELKARRLLTIEVNNARRAIVQVRGRCNKSLGSCRHSERMRTAGEMLRRWAREARLSIACAL